MKRSPVRNRERPTALTCPRSPAKWSDEDRALRASTLQGSLDLLLCLQCLKVVSHYSPNDLVALQWEGAT